jgi:pilus assembly protein Flp/PilA
LRSIGTGRSGLRGSRGLCTSVNSSEGDVTVKNLIARFVREDEGQDVIEYALLAAFISIIAATIFSTIGGNLTTIFNKVQTQTAGAAAS